MAILRVLIAYHTTIGGSSRQTNLDRRAYEARVLPLYEGAISGLMRIYTRAHSTENFAIGAPSQSQTDLICFAGILPHQKTGAYNREKVLNLSIIASRTIVLKGFALKLTHYLLDVTVILLFILAINSEILAPARTLLPV